mgnify:CR=1 FL=1
MVARLVMVPWISIARIIRRLPGILIIILSVILSSVVKPGAVRIGSKGYTADGIMYSAFENLDGTEALVLLNNTDGTKNITVNSGECSLPTRFPLKQSLLSVGIFTNKEGVLKVGIMARRFSRFTQIIY